MDTEDKIIRLKLSRFKKISKFFLKKGTLHALELIKNLIIKTFNNEEIIHKEEFLVDVLNDLINQYNSDTNIDKLKKIIWED